MFDLGFFTCWIIPDKWHLGRQTIRRYVSELQTLVSHSLVKGETLENYVSDNTCSITVPSPEAELKIRWCGVCKVKVGTTSEWDALEEKFHSGACGICDLEINDLKLMREHHRKDHKRAQVKCPDCMVPIRYAQVGKHKCKKASKHEYVRKALEAREARRGLR